MNEAILPLTGGIIIGLSSSLILLGLGKVTGISGILANSMFGLSFDHSWRYSFIGGLLFGGFIMKSFFPELFVYNFEISSPVVILGGLLVGFGTRLGSGCTSGHGVCGLPRKSLRSIVATMVFILFGILTVFLKGLL